MKLIDCILNAIYPTRCPCCGEIGDSELPCEACAEDIENQRLKGKLCLYCGHEKAECECGTYNYLFEGVTAPFYNRGTAQKGIYMLKFSDSAFAARYFGHNMAKVFSERFGDVFADIICTVPPSRGDSKNRAYDKVVLLAKTCSKELGIPLRKNTLKKIRKTAHQHKLSLIERQSNVKGAFKATVRLDGKTVLLIDDIKTTGYTLNECAKQLKLAGAERVFCLTALITLNRKMSKASITRKGGNIYADRSRH